LLVVTIWLQRAILESPCGYRHVVAQAAAKQIAKTGSLEDAPVVIDDQTYPPFFGYGRNRIAVSIQELELPDATFINGFAAWPTMTPGTPKPQFPNPVADVTSITLIN
jgi:hypothetical protein